MKTQQEVEEMRNECLKRMNDLHSKKEEYLFDIDRGLFDLYDMAYQVMKAKYETLMDVLK